MIPVTPDDDPAWVSAVERLDALATRVAWNVSQPRSGSVVLSDAAGHSMTITWYDADTARVESGELLSTLVPLSSDRPSGDDLIDHVTAIARGRAAEGVVLTSDSAAWASVVTIVEGTDHLWRSGELMRGTPVLWRRMTPWTPVARPPKSDEQPSVDAPTA
ncbi:hypothetical protein ATL41_1769 [Flavimobilis soli]|uniref:Uncharacterized protein n=1 Tax=Flavimobilis soli TaxID=442709 RepID=A0A2A9EFG6_9MICO|nr:hypothetical protein [Flavimobilis soli]PFG37025.1 hypothetical protein ATL41_1769 [Flavimobilis soli]